MWYENDLSHVANGEVSAFNKDREIAPRAPEQTISAYKQDGDYRWMLP
jgi:hypothetical protein